MAVLYVHRKLGSRWACSGWRAGSNANGCRDNQFLAMPLAPFPFLFFSPNQALTVISSVCSIRHAVLSVITINPTHREQAAVLLFSFLLSCKFVFPPRLLSVNISFCCFLFCLFINWKQDTKYISTIKLNKWGMKILDHWFTAENKIELNKKNKAVLVVYFKVESESGFAFNEMI